MVIACYAKGRTAVYLIGLLILCVLLYSTALLPPEGVSLKEYLDSKGLFRFKFLVVGWICTVPLLVRVFVIAYQLVFRHSQAVWLAQGKVFYLNIYWNFLYSAVAVSDIEDFAMKMRGGPAARGIVLRLRSGQERVVSTWLLSEAPDVILSRLRAACSGGEAAGAGTL